MAWTPAGTIQISRDWQYTEPIATGSYFRLKHTEARNGDLFAIAQCEVDTDGNLSISDSQVLAVEKGISDVIKLPKTAYTDRRIAIKRVTSQPSLEQELRRLLLPNFLMPPNQEIRFIRKNNWTVNIEVSDYVETKPTQTDYTPQFTDVTKRLTTIEQKIDNIDTSNNSTTPPSTTDPHFDKVSLLMHFDGVNGSTSFTDVKGKTITPYGNAQISTAQSKFGGASGYFDGDGDYLEIPNSSDWDISNNSDFTIETWIYRNSNNNEAICATSPDVVGSGFCFMILNGKLKFESGGGNSSVMSTLTVPINQWVFVTVGRSGNTFVFSVNGTIQTISNNGTFASNTKPLRIGANLHPNFLYYFNGYIDDLRFTKNINRYTSDFALPTTAFPSN